MHSIKHKVSPLHEQLLVQDHASEATTYMPSASTHNGGGRTAMRTVKGSPLNAADLRIDGLLESKLSETIPVRPEHRDLLNKSSKADLLG